MQPVNCPERGGQRAGRHRHPAGSAGRHGHAAGSAERFAAEALPHLGQLYPAALRLAGVPSDAEHLVIETYARAYRSLGQRGNASITAWLYRNMAGAAEERGLTGGTGDGYPGSAVPERHEPPVSLDDVPGSDVVEALEQVPAQSRLAIYLADVEGFSSSAIARIMQLPASRVISRLHQGRRQLRAALEARA